MTVNRIIPGDNLEINNKTRDENGVWDIEIIANGSSDGGIEFYSWDCSYNPKKGFRPSLFIDKNGRNQHKFYSQLKNLPPVYIPHYPY